jgi:ubiquinone/menaquinone biosynthesis C-methylase UbiE
MSEHEVGVDRRKVFDALAVRWDDMRPAGAQDAAVESGLTLVGALAGRVVVDVGCGTGLVEGHLLRHVEEGRIIALDSSLQMLERARSKYADQRIEWVCEDVLGANLLTGSVDVVLCYNTWPHFDDPEGVIREFSRWLRPHGMALVWHDIGRERLAAIHAGAGGPIALDRLLPVSDLGAMFSKSGFALREAEEDADSYTLLAQRSCGPASGVQAT